jgi:hypothetical protein
MPASVDIQVKRQVVKQWLSGDSRHKIAADNRIVGRTITNIVNEWRKRLDDSEFDDTRDSIVSLKKQGIGLSELTGRTRLYTYIKKLGANEDQVECCLSLCLDGFEPIHGFVLDRCINAGAISSLLLANSFS